MNQPIKLKSADFKHSKKFIEKINKPCLVAKIRNSDLFGIAAQYMKETRTDPACKIYLVGKDSKTVSKWQREKLDWLFVEKGIVEAVKQAMSAMESEAGKEFYLGHDDKEILEIKKHGLGSYLRMDTILIDELAKTVIMEADSELPMLHEHGVTIFQRKGRWRGGDGDEWIDYLRKYDDSDEREDKERDAKLANWKKVFPMPSPDSPLEKDFTPLCGTWCYDKSKSAEFLKKRGFKAAAIKKAISAATKGDLKWRFSKNPNHFASILQGYVIDGHIGIFERRGCFYSLRKTPEYGGLPYSIWCDGQMFTFVGSDRVYTKK